MISMVAAAILLAQTTNCSPDNPLMPSAGFSCETSGAPTPQPAPAQGPTLAQVLQGRRACARQGGGHPYR